MPRRYSHSLAPLPEGLRWVAPNTTQLGGCGDGHLARDDGKLGTLCGLIHGGTTIYGPTELRYGCGNCLRIAKLR